MTPIQRLPGPRGHWLLGCLPKLRRDMLGFFDECHREFGDVAYFRAGNRRSVLLSHPDDIERCSLPKIAALKKTMASVC